MALTSIETEYEQGLIANYLASFGEHYQFHFFYIHFHTHKPRKVPTTYVSLGLTGTLNYMWTSGMWTSPTSVYWNGTGQYLGFSSFNNGEPSGDGPAIATHSPTINSGSFNYRGWNDMPVTNINGYICESNQV